MQGLTGLAHRLRETPDRSRFFYRSTGVAENLHSPRALHLHDERKVLMHWRLLLTTFSTIFIAEIGDKTQLTSLSLAASGQSKWAVFLGSSLALVFATGISVLVGSALSRVVPERWLRRAAGLLFLALGVLMLSGHNLLIASASR